MHFFSTCFIRFVHTRPQFYLCMLYSANTSYFQGTTNILISLYGTDFKSKHFNCCQNVYIIYANVFSCSRN